jgi:hypothetical protein
MRNLLIGFALMLGVAVPQFASAEAPAAAQPAPPTVAVTPSHDVLRLLDRLSIEPIMAAQAAQCEDEGENCTSDAQCCSGLECTGAPHATCMPAD